LNIIKNEEERRKSTNPLLDPTQLTYHAMYFAFIYDHRYMKNDRDFYGDAILCFYPAERKESVSDVCLFFKYPKSF
jgi:hypothetical protein